MKTLILAITLMAACTTAQAQPYPGQTVNAVKGDGTHVTGVLLSINKNHRSGVNSNLVRVRVRQMHYAASRVIDHDAWLYCPPSYTTTTTYGGAVPVVSPEVRYVLPTNLNINVNNSANNSNNNRNDGAGGSRQPVNVTVTNNNQDNTRQSVVNPYATGYARYGYVYYGGTRYYIRRYYTVGGVRRGYYDPYYGTLVRW